MSKNTKGQCPSPRAEVLAAHNQSIKMMRLFRCRRPEASEHHPRTYNMMQPGTVRPKYQVSRSELELKSHHVGVSHRAAQRRFDLLLPRAWMDIRTTLGGHRGIDAAQKKVLVVMIPSSFVMQRRQIKTPNGSSCCKKEKNG